MFKNEYTMTRKLIKEYVFSIIGIKFIAFGIISFLFGIFLFNVFDNYWRHVMLACSVIGLICSIVTPILLVYQSEETAKRLHNGKIQKSYIEFNDNIKMDEGKAHVEIEYSQITKVIQTRNFFILKMGNSSAILVYKNGFTNGSKEDFMKFINGKIA